ncbi:FscRII [Burkholderia oklahomensis]|uniref:FscRII n=1 Tax=Burkholderia oklahomensis TaxID=342113 RepID=UPI0026541E9C|nr:FscRII [Burkholderia oklahomensis]MDN7676365.1 FscRII [Burkholderia oklahomensis]
MHLKLVYAGPVDAAVALFAAAADGRDGGAAAQAEAAPTASPSDVPVAGAGRSAANFAAMPTQIKRARTDVVVSVGIGAPGDPVARRTAVVRAATASGRAPIANDAVRATTDTTRRANPSEAFDVPHPMPAPAREAAADVARGRIDDAKAGAWTLYDFKEAKHTVLKS